ncbi:TRIC cation channel family protein [Rubrivirga sp. S365]|uniref:TRIC cation channel family protein n=1 Tax=Rubrivirga litoralis TaxID=3075598 RepID=A0ABU3BNI0_9BACT|nr:MULTISPECIES: TRIC cation channel family protein [unclassified Rubrivirga]MDT0630823.1 TRIC cation channel family protein [Rubrivirga sp. F394]MDT7857375.1 TRIC cation channel family protein [Rubrivirga sp. S365]
MLTVLDFVGTFVFAASGALRGVQHRLDLLGVAVVAVATGVGGGLVRDVLLGATPPAALVDERYLVVCLAGAALAAAAAATLVRLRPAVQLADAVGLGVFAAMGAAKGAAFGLGPLGVILMGGLTATGGGVIRDVLVLEVPSVLRHDLYATAALAGGAVYAGGAALGIASEVGLGAAAAVATGLRLLAMWRGLRLPRPAGVS